MAFLSDLTSAGNRAVSWYNNNPIISQVAVPGLATLYNQRQQSGAINQATGQMTQGINQGLSTLNQFYGSARSDAAPYMQAGLSGLGQYQNLLTDPNKIKESEDYKFRLQEGQQALERSAAAKGMLMSGNTLQDLQKYGQGYATRELDAALQRRVPLMETGLTAHQSLANLGGNYAQAIADLYGQRGDVQALGTQAQADVRTGTVQDTLGILEGLGRTTAGTTGTPGNITSLEQIRGGLNLPGVGNIPLSDLMAAGGGTAAGALEAANLISRDTAMGAKTWADLSMGPRQSGLAGLTNDAGSMMGKIGNFLSTAPGMGIAAGLITGITTGDWKKGATVGLGTAAGAKLGTMVSPGIGTMIGAALGGIAGGAIGPKPSDKASGARIDFNTGTVTKHGEKATKSGLKAATAIANRFKTMADTIKEVFPETTFKKMGFTLGERDGLKYTIYDGNKKITKSAGFNQEKFAQGSANAFAQSIGGLPEQVREAVSKVDFSNPDMAKAQLNYIKQTMMA